MPFAAQPEWEGSAEEVHIPTSKSVLLKKIQIVQARTGDTERARFGVTIWQECNANFGLEEP
jgi:hypothetical protein